jgi:hypothetical protein
MLSLDVEKELGMEFDKARLHGESGHPYTVSC